jgi:hypothetical protein
LFNPEPLENAVISSVSAVAKFLQTGENSPVSNRIVTQDHQKPDTKCPVFPLAENRLFYPCPGADG